jgi:hypothetical protein
MFLDIVFIMCLVFIVQYWIISWISTNSSSNITSSLNKVYLGTIYALITAFIYVLLIDFKQGSLTDCNYYIGLGISIGILTYAYKNQIGITDYDWANSMIELQSNGIMLSQKMAEQKLTNPNQNQTKCIDFSKYIVKAQEEQIDLLKQLSSNSNTKGLFY